MITASTELTSMVALSDCSALEAIESKFDVKSTDVVNFI